MVSGGDAKTVGPQLAMRGIWKSFPGVQALADVDLEVRHGEVHALVGENGAGKSTLMHILAGVYRPDAGTIDWDGQSDVSIANEHAAQRFGIGIVYQERSLFAKLSTAENVFAGRQPVRWWHIDRRQLHEQCKSLLQRVGLSVDPRTPVGQLSPAEQQLVEVAKALSLGARLLIFDEPTAALSERETRTLFELIAHLKQQHIAIIYISHRLEEIFHLADRVTVLKDGRVQGTLPVASTTLGELVSRMVGREIAPSDVCREPVPETSPMALEVRQWNDRPQSEGGPGLLRDINFSARSGEIVVFAGLSGAGRTELALSLFGARRNVTGELYLFGRRVAFRSPDQAIAAGVGYLPEDRKEAGLFLDMSIAANIASAGLKQLGTWWMRDRQRDQIAGEFVKKLQIAARSVRQSALGLSGGNQQKTLLAKWLMLGPKVLIVDEPTRGIDVGAKAEVHSLLYELARKGTAVIVISSELPEVLAVADRIIVLHEGVIAGELSRDQATEENVIHLASVGKET